MLKAWLCLGMLALGGQREVDDFSSLAAWTLHADGGIRCQWEGDRTFFRSPPQGLRIRYRDAAPHWSNLRRSVSLPPQTTAVVFWLWVHRAAPGAAMHVWLLEPDGDGWVQRVVVEGRNLEEVPPGWRRVELPMGGFRYQPRGDGRRALSTTDRLLIGCNFADLEVTLDDLAFSLREEGPSMTPPKTEPWRLEEGPSGRAAILRDPDFPVHGAPSDPERLARWLRQAGWGVTFVRAGDLTDEERLNRRSFDLLVLPCGASFPAQAADPFRNFLKAGGRWIHCGGYALDRPLTFTEEGWKEQEATLTAREVEAGARPLSLNTRLGRPGDTLGLHPDQIGVFDPSYQLQHVAFVQAAPGQFVLPPEVRFEAPLEGFAAVAMTGSNSPVFPRVYARWIPLLATYDRFGRERGPAMAAVLHYDGPYKGSAWAFAGATNFDVWGEERWRFAFLRLADFLRRSLFLHSLETNLACYRDGEGPWLRVQVANFGPEMERVRVWFRVRPGLPEEQGPEAFQSVREATLPPGETASLGAEWRPERFTADFYTVEALLERWEPRGDFLPWDRMETGFVVWREEVLQRGFALRFAENYFRDEQGRARFLIGTNQTGMMWFSANENPLVWARDFAAMRENGLRLLRILHFSPFAARGYEGQGSHSALNLAQEPPLKLQRQTDAIVQLAQKYGIALFLSLHDWLPVELTEEELEAQRRWAEYWARRYREVPGLLYDVQNEPTVGLPDRPHVQSLWSQWLLQRHGSREGVWQAWGQEGEPPVAFDTRPLSSEWADGKALDLNLFKVFLLNRWVRANREGVKAGNPQALVSVGYLPSLPPADKVLGAAHVDVSNTHFYGSLRDFLRQFKLIDRRFEGKSLSLGEFGAQAAHDARVRGEVGDRPRESIEWFLAVSHAAFALGGSFIANWDWKDLRDCVFPWGLRHADLRPKPVALAYRCIGRFLGALSPVYRSPEVFLLLPDSHRLGAQWTEVHQALFHALDLLLQCQVNFGVLNEWALEGGIPPTRALLWPIPYCPDDVTFERVRRWVEEGGVLYLSGDVQFDERRRPTRAARRAALGLPPAEPRSPWETTEEAWLQPPLVRGVGKGKVFFVAAPIETRPRPENRALYLRFLQEAGVERIPLEPDSPEVLAGTLPLEGGGIVCILLNTGDEPRRVTWRGPMAVTLTLEPRRPGLIACDAQGRLRALEGQKEADVAGKPWLRGEGQWMLLMEDRSWAFLPLEAGTYRFSFLPQGKPARVLVSLGPGQTWEAMLSPSKEGWSLTVPPELAGEEFLLLFEGP